MCILEQQCDIVLNKKRELREVCVKVRKVNLGRLKKKLSSSLLIRLLEFNAQKICLLSERVSITPSPSPMHPPPVSSSIILRVTRANLVQ